MADYEEDAAGYEEEAQEEEEVLEVEGGVEEEGAAAAELQRAAEAADLLKLLKQHPEIWIPYEEQVQEGLALHARTLAPAPEEEPESKCGLRNLAGLDSKHITYPFLTNYERTKCISYRASQLCNGAKPYILVPEGVTDSYEIAKLELEAKRLPLIVKRPLPDGTFEVWRLSDLMLL